MVKSNIKEITGRHGINVIAKHCKISEQSLYTYIRRGYASIPKHERLAEFDPFFPINKFEDDVLNNMAKHAIAKYKLRRD
jgi:hypothetical protein